MTHYNTLQNKPHVLRSLTGLYPDEFETLLRGFAPAYDEFVRTTFIEDKKRQRAYGGGRRPVLKTYADKLLFILFYFRVYPTQEVQGFFFGLSQEQAHEWIHRLTPVLNQALGYEAQLPERRPQRLEEVLRQQPALESPEPLEPLESPEPPEPPEMFIDGTERPIRRPKDQERQKRYYSGKKKRHTVKNLVITNRAGRVMYLSGTYEGKRADKKIADGEDYGFLPGTTLYQDKGFQGYAPPGVETRQPKKKPRGGKLTEEEKAENSSINKVRVRVEHAIGGVKVFRIVGEVFRNYKQGYDDAVMEIACGLHNMRRSRPVPVPVPVGS